MMWISVEEVIAFTGLKPQHLKLEKTNIDGLEDIVSDWITQCQSLIETYTNQEYSDSAVPGAVRNVCLRLTSNMVALSVARRDTPITQPNEWTVQILSSEIFSQDLKDDLDPFVIERVSSKSDKVMVFTVTGDDL